jgi:hypothetical protein
MASYPPPEEQLPIFNAQEFLIPLNATITLAEADAKYLARQDTAISIAQTTSFSDNITIGNSLLDYIPAQGLQIKPTVVSEAVFIRTLDGAGNTVQRIECNETHTHLYDQTRLTESATPANYTSLQQTGIVLDIYNTVPSGAINFRAENSVGGITTPLSLTQQTITITPSTVATGLNGLVCNSAFFGRNDTGANTFTGTLGYTRHPIGWTISFTKVLTAIPSASTTNIITASPASGEFSALSNGVWMLGCNIGNTVLNGTCTSISSQWGVTAGGTIINTAQYTTNVVGNFQLDASNVILRATGNGSTTIIYNFYPVWTVQPTFTFIFYAIKLG